MSLKAKANLKPSSLHYRHGSHADFEQLMALGKKSYAEFAEILSEDNWAEMKATLNDGQALEALIEKSKICLCLDGTQLVGMLFLVPSGHPTELFSEAWAYVRFLAVDPAYRGLGIGKRLTESCIARARTNKEKTLALHTGEFMGPAKAIYEKMGFVKGRELQYLGQKYWIYLLDLT